MRPLRICLSECTMLYFVARMACSHGHPSATAVIVLTGAILHAGTGLLVNAIDTFACMLPNDTFTPT